MYVMILLERGLLSMKETNVFSEEKDNFILKHVATDIKMAEFALHGFTSEQDLMLQEAAAYNLSQAFEKLLKYRIFVAGESYRKTHQIGLLLAQLQQLDIAYPKEFDSLSYMLSAWSVETRYGQYLGIKTEDIKGVLQICKELLVEYSSL